MEQSIFSKIISGEIPAHKIYENEKTLAFLDIHPVQPGHTLVIPKVQVDHLWDLPADYYLAVWEASRQVSRHMKEVLGRNRIGVQVMGQDVPHAHVHLIPYDTVDEFRNVPDMNAEPDHESLEAMADKLRIS
jgi:histidine triad (HIT) family protein